MKVLKIKLNIIIFFIALFFGTSNIVYAENGLDVEFESTPLFSEINFIPGESVTKYIKVTNTLGKSQTVVVSAINSNSCDKTPCLSEAINLIIKREDNELFNGSLEDFLNGDEINLGNLNNGSSAEYDFIVTFLPEKENEYQSLSSTFDLLIGFQGGVFVNSGAGGGGGSAPRGLTIKNETSILLNLDSVVIQWNTSYLSTSQVIYREEGQNYSLDLSLPNYGYPYGTSEDLVKVLNHSVLLADLEAGKTYYYRAVSHASPATVGIEHSFKMLTEEEINQKLGAEEERYFSGYSGFHEGLSDNDLDLVMKLTDGGTLILNDKDNNGQVTSTTTTVSTSSFSASDNLKNVAMAGGFFSDSPWWIWLVILLIIFILVYLFFKVWNTD
ncbi:MAG: hypothetical protein UR79_C0002G0204 [Candidatus Campbellbacteria bacterium GW2011_GWD1_35_49]|nr:MAG: hypothetical protein UR74_C0002G0129 [Candidatus Campbellbacteria bacterium GW2011_GWD2_35_24]KKP75749.1 MAG: seg [Candidatus Campbellbacteria bacterium GW2011_GWC2_35_28]KKP77003.1 MAG: hypothetical protein UR76_C0002G0204 [Candidatus Campbellbacteria bacterium GW2011_GWC1_35_31]KKP78929.1 MAG: hypothetical protein UR79_C0002G0204 [Candidatus Campbellbacteria bacterium GW2011_GWD1_35_49]